jgi:hypothetical protein
MKWSRPIGKIPPPRIELGSFPYEGSVLAVVLWRSKRETGIEPASSAWKAAALPLSYTRIRVYVTSSLR